MSEGTQPGRYCRNCGTEIRPGMTFCVSCGTPVTPVGGGPGPSSPGFDLPERMRSFLGDLRRSLWQSRDGLSGTFSGFGTDGIKRIPRRALNWFRDLSGVPKLVLVGLVLLVLLIVLSPVAVIVAGLLFGVSIIALIIRVAQKGSLKNWGLVAVGSMVLMFAFGGISGALYGGVAGVLPLEVMTAMQDNPRLHRSLQMTKRLPLPRSRLLPTRHLLRLMEPAPPGTTASWTRRRPMSKGLASPTLPSPAALRR